MSKRICWCGHDRKEHNTIWSGASSLKERPACRPDCDHYCRGFVEPQTEKVR